jgi:hypothetical protein
MGGFETGLSGFEDWLLSRVVQPFAAVAFSDFSGAEGLDFRHGYVIGYAPSSVIPRTLPSGTHIVHSGLELHTGFRSLMPSVLVAFVARH